MKKLMFLVAASLFVFAACSSEDDSSPEVNPENAAITFELSAVNDRRNWNPDAGV